VFEAGDGVDELHGNKLVVAHAHFNGGEDAKIIFRQVPQQTCVKLNHAILSTDNQYNVFFKMASCFCRRALPPLHHASRALHAWAVSG
jgi:hypothetical protein